LGGGDMGKDKKGILSYTLIEGLGQKIVCFLKNGDEGKRIIEEYRIEII
jgi:hypothetical protein